MKTLVAALAAAAFALTPFASQEIHTVTAAEDLGWCSAQDAQAGPGPCT